MALLEAVLVKDPAARPTAAALLERPAVSGALRAVEEAPARKEEKETLPPPPPPVTTAPEERVVVAPSTAAEEDATALAKLMALQQRVGVRV